MSSKIAPGVDGEKYIPYKNRSGEESDVFFTSDLSAEGLTKIFDCIGMHRLTKSSRYVLS